MTIRFLNDEDMSSLIHRLYTKNNTDKNFLRWFSHTEHLFDMYKDQLDQFINLVNAWLFENKILSILIMEFKGDIRNLRSIEWTIKVLYED